MHWQLLSHNVPHHETLRQLHVHLGAYLLQEAAITSSVLVVGESVPITVPLEEVAQLGGRTSLQTQSTADTIDDGAQVREADVSLVFEIDQQVGNPRIELVVAG